MNTRLLAVALVLFALPLFAQDKFGEAVQISIVEVPVTAVDSEGRAIRGLTKENFELYDEGKRVPIEYFETVEIAGLSAATARSRRLPPVATRNFLLLFDYESSSPGAIARAQEAAQRFLERAEPLDLVSVATYRAERGVRLLTSFTADRALTRAAIASVTEPEALPIADPLMLSTTPEASRDNRVAGVGVAVASANLDHNVAAQKFSDVEQRSRLRIQFNNFGRLAQMLNRLHGQKQVILLSEGFDARLVQGREDLSSQQSREEIDQIFFGEGYKVDTDQRFGNTGSARDLSDMVRLFRRSDVVMHAIDIAGLRANVDAKDGAKRSSNEALFLVTTPTGGTVFRNVNDLSENFSRMLKQQEVVYLLGFRAPGTGKPGTFHDLKVKAANAKVARLTHRSGYFESSLEAGDLEKTLTLAEIITTDLPIDDVAVSLSAMAMPGPNVETGFSRSNDGLKPVATSKARVPVMVEIPGTRLLDGLASPTATATLFLYAFNHDNRVVDHLVQRIALDLAKAGATLRESGIRYYGTLRVPPGTYALKALVRVEESGRIGFTRSELEVPAFDSATVLPPLLFAAPEKWLMLTGPSRGDEFPYPFAAGDAKYVPFSRPVVNSGGEYKLALFLYRVPMEGLDVSPVIAGADGSTRAANVTLVGRTAADDDGGTKLLLSFRPDGLRAGNYELRLTVRPKDGNESLVSMPFVLR